ncbi:Rieske (2Fe-2S) protein [Alicyclobacillus kakegawensis]|uniref:Rieske (2Fe-2S) protein n=1 Tax=Alicyclobacillus kakegawensis TaxID=392012 RepID=UPI000832BA8E|nr:non-heme iron oxygenase ferredoxin subunit [Alicyclobacillus kakegawensis]
MSWIKVAGAAQIPTGHMMRVQVEDEDIALYHLDDGWYATSAICTHAYADLTTGRLQDAVVTCPKHGGQFNVKTGAAVKFPCVVALATYPVEVRGEDVFIDFE